jgi:hypothetical protein
LIQNGTSSRKSLLYKIEEYDLEKIHFAENAANLVEQK